MFGKFPIEINRASKIVTGAFLLMVMATALISEFFQAPKDITTDINHFRLLFSQESFTDISKFSIRNRIGKFSFIRIGNSTRWNLTEPHPISANVETINKIFNVLRQINVRGTHSNDAINISNYALSNPSMEIELTHSNGRTYKLSFGLVNPIDNSTYLLDSSQQIIYQIDNALSSLERTSLADVVNSKPFAFGREDLKSLLFYRGLTKEGAERALLIKEGQAWKQKNGSLLDESKVATILDPLLSLKSTMILDQIPAEATKTIEAQLKSPLYSIEITTTDNQKQTFIVSPVIADLKDVKVEKNSIFLISNSKGDFPYLISKDYFKVFNFIP